MTKPWNHPPGKIFHTNKPIRQAEEGIKKRAEFDKKWDAVFGEHKLNNIQENENEGQSKNEQEPTK